MTGVANIARANVAGGFIGRINAVMTTIAGLAAHQAVIKHHVPIIRGMTAVAGIGRGDVCWPLTLRDDIIVATATGAAYLAMVNTIDRNPGTIVVAGITQITAVDVCWCLTSGVYIVVTIKAGLANHGAVIECDIPIIGVMAGVTCFGRGNVQGMLSGRDNTVVTGGTDADNLGMIHSIDRRPRCIVVTGLATIAAIDMCRRLASGVNSIMTIKTGLTGDGAVIECHIPIRGAMAGIASLRGDNMCGALAGGNHAIMTTFATSDDFNMINATDGSPVCSHMAGVTVIAGIDVCCILSTRDDAVVTTDAAADNLGVINGCCRTPEACFMTGGAVIGGIDVSQIFTGRDYAIMTAVTGT